MKTLQKMMRKVKRGQGGFTLIELLVVVAILGVIAAVVLNVGGFIGTGKCEAFQTEQHQVQTACIACLVDDGCTLKTGDMGPGSDTGGQWQYLVGELQYKWNVATDGTVTLDSGETNPCD